jgi:hypothetical protein
MTFYRILTVKYSMEGSANMAFESEIPRELIENKIYTSRQLKLCIMVNDVKIMCKGAVQFIQKDLKYRVTKIIKGSIESSLIDYTITPDKKEKVYVVEKV